MQLISTPVIIVVTMLTCFTTGQRCNAATDCDVTVLKASSVVIEADKITITAEANIAMVIILPKGETDGRPFGFAGRETTWIKMKADDATFTVLREGKGDPSQDVFWKMSVDAAEALKAGEKIDRMGFYRPDINIKKNRIHEIAGKGYVFPKRESKP